MFNPVLRISLITFLSYMFMGMIVPPVHEEYDWVVTGGVAFSEFGFWIDGGGDVNGDGFDDIIIGAPTYTHDLESEGAVFMYYGSPDGLSAEPDWVQYGELNNSGFGHCVSIGGDVNGDGYDDVLIGAHQFKNTWANEGKVYFYPGGPDGPSATPTWTMVSGRKGAKLGEAVTILGDVNLDGYDDIAVGAHGWDATETLGDLGNKAGKAWVFLGTAEGPAATENFVELGSETDANIGVSLDRAGDINGDGYMDITIGGYIFLIGDGMICVFRGDPDGIDEDLEFMAIGGAEDTSFYAINQTTAGDVNGDGYDDVCIGAPRYDANGIYQSGKLHIHYGSPDGLQDEVGWIGTGSQFDERWAFNVNEAGDINHDGYGDLLVGSKYFQSGTKFHAGKGELYLGGPQGLSHTPNWTFAGPDSGMCIGANISRAGDVNGDGFDDIILAGDEYSGAITREGIVYAFYGQAQQCDPLHHVVPYYITPNSVTIGWEWLYGAKQYKFCMLRMDGPSPYYVIPTTDSVVTVGGLVPGAHYRGYVIAQCDGGWTNRSNIFDIYTPLHRESAAGTVSLQQTLVHSALSVETSGFSGPVRIQIFDMSGRVLYDKTENVDGVSEIRIYEVGGFPQGTYMVRTETAEGSQAFKIVKQ